VLIPQVEGEWWTIAGNPDLGKYTTARQQPVDFAVWEAADGTWQLWSCIRETAFPGGTRVFHRWQAARLTDRDWEPMGIAMRTDPNFGENVDTAQAPFVLKLGGEYWMFYGAGSQISLAKGVDGKTFARQLRPNGKSALFADDANGGTSGTRDVMVLRIGDLYHAYYTTSLDKRGAVYVRTSKDLRHWGPARVVARGGSAGDGPWSAECPFVHFHKESGYYYMFRTQRYRHPPQTMLYRSKDPLDFGVDSDRHLVATLPLAAPELVEHKGQLYLAALLPELNGIRIARLKWVPKD
jgi:hypothetical protein